MTTVSPASLLPMAPKPTADTELGTVRQTAVALQILSYLIFFVSSVCFVLLDAPTNNNARPLIVLILGALIGFASCLIALCIKSPNGNPGGNLNTMACLSMITAIWYIVGSLAVAASMSSDIVALQDGSACGGSMTKESDYGFIVVRCAQVAHHVGGFVIIDVMFGVIAAYCHVRMAYQGYAAMNALMTNESTMLKSPA